MPNSQWQTDEVGTREVNSEVDWKLTENWLSYLAHRIVSSVTRHNWRLIQRGITQGQVSYWIGSPYPILFKIFSTELNVDAEHTLTKSADDLELGGTGCCTRCLCYCSEQGERQKNWAESKWRIFPIYSARVRLCWEHCAHSWDPQYKKKVVILQWVQWRVTKISKDLEHLSYKKRLKELCLSQLEKAQDSRGILSICRDRMV